MKIWNFLIEQDSLEIQDLVSAYDLYNICFLSNLKGFELPHYYPKSKASPQNKLSILDLFSSKIEVCSNTTIALVETYFEHDICTLKDDNGNPYQYEYIQTHFNTKKRGRHKRFKYNDRIYSSIYELTQKEMAEDIKTMSHFFAKEISQINIERLDSINSFNHYSEKSPIRRYSFSIGYDSIFHKQQRDSSKMNSLEKSELIMEILQYNKSPLAVFIEKYLMLSQTQQNKISNKLLKF